MEERRKTEQIPVYDENGRIEYYRINNYREKKNFLTIQENKMLRTLLGVAKKLNEENKKSYITVFSQVALNRIIEFNNLRITEQSKEEIKNKSIDFVLYDVLENEIIACIELNGKEHETGERKERDELLKKIFQDTEIKLIFEKNKFYYREDEILDRVRE